MIRGIQVIGILVGLYLIAQTILNFRRGNYDARRAAFWLILWTLMVALFFNPSLMALAMPILTTRDTIMSLLVMGLTGTFVLIAQIYQKMAGLDRKLTRLVQNLAIHDYLKDVASRGKKEDE